MPATKQTPLSQTDTLHCPDCWDGLEKWGEGQWVCPSCCGLVLTAQAPAPGPEPDDGDPYPD